MSLHALTLFEVNRVKYIIMCGWNEPTQPKHLQKFNDETIIERTIRLLRENGVTDIAISSNHPAFEGFGVPVLHHANTYPEGCWLEAFFPTDEPVCYIFGDVIFSGHAIRKIVQNETTSVQFFASAPPFAEGYSKRWAEPFAFKVADQKAFRDAINRATELGSKGAFKRGPIAWELWQVYKGTPLNEIDYTNYCIINDWTCDCDYEGEMEQILGVLDAAFGNHSVL